MEGTGLDVVTGAFSYTGSYIASRLLDAGRKVRTLTAHPRHDHPLTGRVEVVSYRFDQPEQLVHSFKGAATFYNTYWVRFPRGDTTFHDAVGNSRALFEAAARAGVECIVHVSITNADAGWKWPYFRGKATVEQLLAEAGVAYSIVRPTVVFGWDDVLVNNIAWLLRHSPLFAIPGRGDYRVRPVFVDDLARLCVESASMPGNHVLNAVGPDILTFEEMVRVVRDAVGSRARLLHVPPAMLPALTRLIGLVVRDVLLTREELGGLMDELVTVEGPATGSVSFREWVGANAEMLGRSYASELGRHFRTPTT